MMIDAFMGDVLSQVTPTVEKAMTVCVRADFTPNNKYVVISKFKSLSFWDWKNKKELPLPEQHVRVISGVKHNTEYAVLATTCQNLVIWTPDNDEES